MDSRTGRIVLQPSSITPFGQVLGNAIGGRVSYQGLQLKFPLDDLREPRPVGSEPFVLTIIGQGKRETRIEIKDKH
jgi:hypothetical protein